jgi:hypothetical protein
MRAIRNQRRNAIVINSAERGSSELRIFQKVYTASSNPLIYKRLKNEVKIMSKKMCSNEIMLDIKKYKDQWKEYKNIRDKALFAKKINNDIKEFEEKYGMEGGRILEILIVKSLNDPKLVLPGTIFFNRLVKVMYKNDKASVCNYKFPYVKLVTLEVLLSLSDRKKLIGYGTNLLED